MQGSAFIDCWAPGWQRPARLAGVACGALLIGVLVYLTDRAGTPALLIPQVPALAGHPVFGALGQWLPSFVHPLALSLLTAAALPASATPRYGVCVAWCVVNGLFEAGQHAALKQPLAEALYAALGRSAPVHALANYFVRGTFDLGDLLAAALGAGVAAAVLCLDRPRQELRHAR